MVMAGEEGLTSPKNRMKFLCSHGGKILPRPSDGQLKYVGGETRVIAVPRSITFSELMKKLTSLFDVDVVLKYQLVPEDLDALVSVTCDEDLKHMLDEYDRYDAKLSGNSAAPRLRAFLFPSTPLLVVDNNVIVIPGGEMNLLEQRYIAAINGFLRTNPNVDLSQVFSNSSSGGGSPPSIGAPDAASSYPTNDSSNATQHDSSMYNSTPGDAPPESYTRYRTQQESGMGRVQSSPNLVSTGQHQPNHHLAPHQHQHIQSRLGRPTGEALQTVRSDAARYQIGQLAKRYWLPVGVGFPGGNSGCMGYGHVEGSSFYRGGGGGGSGGDGDSFLQSHSKQRLGGDSFLQSPSKHRFGGDSFPQSPSKQRLGGDGFLQSPSKQIRGGDSFLHSPSKQGLEISMRNRWE